MEKKTLTVLGRGKDTKIYKDQEEQYAEVSISGKEFYKLLIIAKSIQENIPMIVAGELAVQVALLVDEFKRIGDFYEEVCESNDMEVPYEKMDYEKAREELGEIIDLLEKHFPNRPSDD